MKFPKDWRKYEQALRPYLLSNNGHMKYELPVRLCRDPQQRLMVCAATPSDFRAIRNKISELQRIMVPGGLEVLMGYKKPNIGTSLGDKLLPAMSQLQVLARQPLPEEPIEFEGEDEVIVTASLPSEPTPIILPSSTRLVVDLGEIRAQILSITATVEATQKELVAWEERKKQLEANLQHQQQSLKEHQAYLEAAELMDALRPSTVIPKLPAANKFPPHNPWVTAPSRIISMVEQMFALDKTRGYRASDIFAWLRSHNFQVRDAKAVSAALNYAVKHRRGHHIQRVEDGIYSWV